MASSLVAGNLMPDAQSAAFVPPVASLEAHAVTTGQTCMADEGVRTEGQGTMVITWPEDVLDWTPALEREFRRLAMLEATCAASADELARIEELSRLRQRLDQPRTTDEILRQLKHDRLLEMIADTLREYAEFQKGARKKRTAAR